MARLADYLKNLREQQKSKPATDEETEQKAEAYDYLISGEGDSDE